MDGTLLAPLTILLELNLALNFFLVFTAPVVNAFAVLTGQFNEKILGHKLILFNLGTIKHFRQKCKSNLVRRRVDH